MEHSTIKTYKERLTIALQSHTQNNQILFLIFFKSHKNEINPYTLM